MQIMCSDKHVARKEIIDFFFFFFFNKLVKKQLCRGAASV